MTARFCTILLLSFILYATLSNASNVPVRYKEGLTHGFLVLSTLDGDHIAEGDLTEVARGSQVTNHLVYHFKDGSLQDETTVFSQRSSFALISYRLIEKGPSFPRASDVSFTTSSGQVTVRYTNDKGEEKVESKHMQLPPDLANGLVLTLVKNIRSGDPPLEVKMLVATPKPRIVKLIISQDGKDTFSIAGSNREGIHYLIKVDIGGLEGLIASWIKKQPPDNHVWITSGDAPTFVKSESLSYFGGPMWRTELTSPVWPKEKPSDAKDAQCTH